MTRFGYCILALAIAGISSRVEAKMDINQQTAITNTLRKVVHEATTGGNQKVMGDITMRAGNGDNLPYPGSDYLGIGYNLAEGNPEGDPLTQMDPGFRAPVITLQWSQDYISRDVRDLQPIGGYAMPEVACYQNDEVKTTSNEEEYKEELSEQVQIDASVSGGYGGFSGEASFSASRGSNSFTNNIASTTDTRFSVTSFCIEFKVAFATFTDWSKQILVPDLAEFAPNLKPVAGKTLESNKECVIEVHELVADCRDDEKDYKTNCPLTCDLALWFGFFEEYGTHFLSTVHLGGKRITETILSEEAKTAIENTGTDAATAVKVAASYDGLGGSASASAGVASENSASNGASVINTNSGASTKTKVFGGIPPADSDANGFNEWAQTVRDFPMPVRYTLTSNYVMLKHVPDKQFSSEDFEYASTMYIPHAQAVAKKVAEEKAELKANVSANKDAAAAAAKAALIASTKTITTRTGDKLFVLKSRVMKGEYTECPRAGSATTNNGAKKWFSPNGKIEVIWMQNGHIGVYQNKDGFHQLWSNNLDMSSEQKYNEMRKDDTWDRSDGENERVDSTNSGNIVYYYGCGTHSDTFYELDVHAGSSGFMLRTKMVHDYDKDEIYERQIWNSKECGRNKAYGQVAVQDNGLFAILDPEGEVIWSTDTTKDGKPAKAPNSSYGAGKCN